MYWMIFVAVLADSSRVQIVDRIPTADGCEYWGSRYQFNYKKRPEVVHASYICVPVSQVKIPDHNYLN